MKSEHFHLLLLFMGIAECSSEQPNHNLRLPPESNGLSGKYAAIKLKRINIRKVRSDPKRKVMHQYPVYTSADDESIKKKVEFVPGIGEVTLEDRFEPRPLFAYRKQQQQSQSGVESTSTSPPRATTVATTTKNLYQSPYSSYNPPDFLPDESPKYFYPPNEAPKTSEENPDYSSKTLASATFGPPLAPAMMGTDESHTVLYKYQDGPPDYSPKDENNVYYAPESAAMDQGSMIDLAAAPGDHNGPFPQYLYDHHHNDHHYDHHVYEEVSHTTMMAPAKEDKRVGSTHYSYYYLGRKLWYVPLYFSIYFIIYVTVLIIKSIVRHKVNLKYKWIENESRQMRTFNQKTEELNSVHQNVLLGIKNATEKYSNVLKM